MFYFDILVSIFEDGLLRRPQAIWRVKVHWISIFFGENHWRVGVREALSLPAKAVQLRSHFITFGNERNQGVRMVTAVALGEKAAARVTLLEVRSRRHIDAY